jgi:membrane protein implicated in regulation of membrane protease activity
MIGMIKFLIGYLLIIVLTAIILILIALSIGWLLNLLIPSIEFGVASILALFSIIYGGKLVYHISGLQSAINDREDFEDDDEREEPQRVIYVDSPLFSRKRARKPRKR